jgi:ribosomal protein S18 acetylase RimI-like enzyme
MFHTEEMTNADYSFAVKLSNTQNWNMTIKDFELMKKIEPLGCFVLYDNSERLGVVTCVTFDKIGWLGNFIIKQKSRYQGAGSFLLKSVLSYLETKNVQTIGLYSYTNLAEFYERFGFKKDEKIFSFYGQVCKLNKSTKEVQVANNKIFSKIVNFDESCIHYNRIKSLSILFSEKRNVLYYLSKNNKIEGYVLIKLYDNLVEIGPLVTRSENENIALILLEKTLSDLSGFNIVIYIPKKYEKIIDFIYSVGLKKETNFIRMFKGPKIKMNSIYLPESLERG